MSETKANYYAIIPANVRYDSKLIPSAKLLYGEITALCNKEGYCWAGDTYFTNLYEVSKKTIQTWLKSLENNGYITREVVYKDGSNEIVARYIRLSPYPMHEKVHTPMHEKVRDNNTSFNNTVNTDVDESSKLNATASVDNKKENISKIVVTYLNDKADKNFSYKSKATQSHINARVEEGRTVDDFKAVIDLKVEQWKHDEKMNNYLRPTTLFAPTNFENYVNEALSARPKQSAKREEDVDFNLNFWEEWE